MDQNERALMEEYAAQNAELKVLLDDHILFEKQIEKLENKQALLPEEEMQLKTLKKQKLDGKTSMYALLDTIKSK